MLSFNHYAYGAVVDWIYRTVAGLAPDIASPGYRRVIMAPRPDDSITFCNASLDAPQGPVSTAWRVEGESFTAVVVLQLVQSSVAVTKCERRFHGPPNEHPR